MNKNDKQAFVNKWYAFIQTKERQNTILFKKALDAQIDIFIKEKNILAVHAGPVFNAMKYVYNKTGVQWANNIRMTMPVSKGLPMGFSKRIIELINQYFKTDFLNVSELITKTTRQLISEVLAKASAIGESFSWMEKELKALNVNRARLIARTETVAAANQAGLLYVKKESPIEMVKEWVPVQDKRTRLHHEEAAGQIVGLDEFFIIGGYEMECPGDKGGIKGRLKVPAKEICNCRCTTVYIPKNKS